MGTMFLTPICKIIGDELLFISSTIYIESLLYICFVSGTGKIWLSKLKIEKIKLRS